MIHGEVSAMSTSGFRPYPHPIRHNERMSQPREPEGSVFSAALHFLVKLSLISVMGLVCLIAVLNYRVTLYDDGQVRVDRKANWTFQDSFRYASGTPNGWPPPHGWASGGNGGPVVTGLPAPVPRSGTLSDVNRVFVPQLLASPTMPIPPPAPVIPGVVAAPVPVAPAPTPVPPAPVVAAQRPAPWTMPARASASAASALPQSLQRWARNLTTMPESARPVAPVPARVAPAKRAVQRKVPKRVTRVAALIEADQLEEDSVEPRGKVATVRGGRECLRMRAAIARAIACYEQRRPGQKIHELQIFQLIEAGCLDDLASCPSAGSYSLTRTAAGTSIQCTIHGSR
jgi:hypothetical protein